MPLKIKEVVLVRQPLLFYTVFFMVPAVENELIILASHSSTVNLY